ncbi:MAG TPA: hypothetical protein VJ201_02270 [Candidatus Babeliales bacterium]|nr:hypothetical protein [Candidatus Babeliales bacterium]
MFKISKAVFSIALITCPTQVIPVTPTKAFLVTLSSGICAGSIGGIIGYLAAEDQGGRWGFGIGAGLTTLVTGLILYNSTPYKNLKYAENLINQCKSNSTIQLITKSKKIDNELIDKLREEFITSDFPIIRSSLWIEKLRRDLVKAKNPLKTAEGDRYWDKSFVEVCKNHLTYTNTTINLIDNVLSFIKKDSEYSLQRKAYEDKIASRQLHHEIHEASRKDGNNIMVEFVHKIFEIIDNFAD